jgi:hypothetical protein
MAEHLFQRGPARFFRGLGPRAQVVLCQLPLTLIVAALAVATPFAWPTLLHSPIYMAGILLHGILFLGCFLVPWERLAHRPYLIVPILDFVAIGLMRNGAAPLLPGLAVLVVFPVIWLSASGMLTRSSLVLSFFGSLPGWPFPQRDRHGHHHRPPLSPHDARRVPGHPFRKYPRPAAATGTR